MKASMRKVTSINFAMFCFEISKCKRNLKLNKLDWKPIYCVQLFILSLSIQFNFECQDVLSIGEFAKNGLKERLS